MLLLTVALTLAQTAPAEPPPEDVIVAAERLKRFRATMRKDRKTGEQRCVVRRASGDPALDRGICDAMLACAPKITREADIRPCMEPAMKALLPKHSWTGTRARRWE